MYVASFNSLSCWQNQDWSALYVTAIHTLSQLLHFVCNKAGCVCAQTWCGGNHSAHSISAAAHQLLQAVHLLS